MEITLIKQPPCRLVIKRGREAKDYFAYCEEVGCDIWSQLKALGSSQEPVALWLPENLRRPGTSTYVQGVLYEADMDQPEGFELLELPAITYLKFQGPPFDEADFAQAIGALQEQMEQYNPAAMNFQWDDTAPRVQLEPIGERGYIELRAVKPRTLSE